MKMSESITKLAPALLEAQKEMGDAVKGSNNPFFKSKFADLNAVREASLPVLAKHGLGAFQPTIEINGEAYVETVIVHASGEWISSQTKVLYVKVGDPQGQGSGISYARRYGLQSFLNIGAADDDGELGMARSAPAKSYTAPVVVASSVTAAKVAASPTPSTETKTEVKPLKSSSFSKTKKPATPEAQPASEPAVSGDGWN